MLLCSLLALAACGGDSSPSPVADLPPTAALTPEAEADALPRILYGRVETGTTYAAKGIVVCVDSNADLQCGADEAKANTDGEGLYAIELTASQDPQAWVLVAELPERDSAEMLDESLGESPVQANTHTKEQTYGQENSAELADGFGSELSERAGTILVASSGTTTISALSTLQWAAESTDPASADLSTDLASNFSSGLAAAARLARRDDPVLTQAARLVQPALSELTKSLSASMPMPAALREAGVALVPVLGAYIDATSGAPLATLSPRTLLTEARHAAIGTPECTVPQVAATVALDTEGGAPIVSKEDYLRATLTIAHASGETQMLSTQVRGRGNSTWTEMPKKPYRLKLDKKTALLGLGEHRDWAVLANYADKTLLRNASALCLGRMLGFEYTPDSRFIELTVNGVASGLYQLTDQIRVEAGRVDIDEDARSDSDTALGFLVEIDVHPGDDESFQSTMGYRYVIKSEIEPEQVSLISDRIEDFEQAMLSAGLQDPDSGYTRYLETDTLVDFYLVNEFLRNVDAFASSTYVHRQRGGKLQFGPLWDFDIAAGNVNEHDGDEAEGWWIRYSSVYVARLIQADPRFRQHLAARWAYLQRRLPDLQAFISGGAEALDAAQARNFAIWPILDTLVWRNPAALGSWEAEVAQLQTWLNDRAEWMTEQFTAGE